MQGMDRVTGRLLSGDPYLRHVISDILTTPFREQATDRAYGVSLYDYIGRKLTDALIADIMIEVRDALIRWVPSEFDFDLRRVLVQPADGGGLEIHLTARFGVTGAPFNHIEVITP